MAQAAEIDDNVEEKTGDAGPVLLRHDAQGIAGLTLNRPDAFNALNKELLSALQNELDSIKEDPEIRAVAITGRGRAFCAGHDLKEMGSERNRVSACSASAAR